MRTKSSSLACLLVLVLVAGWGLGPAMAQPSDPVDLTDLVGFLSASVVSGHPTYVIENGRVADVLANVEAEPLGGGQYKLDIGGDPVIFDVLVHSDIPSFATSIYPGGIPKFTAGATDVLAMTNRDRQCTQVSEESKGQCRYDDSRRLYYQTFDPPRFDCVEGNEYCTEFVAVGWRYRYFYDSCCLVEAPGEGTSNDEVITHNCIKCP